MPTVTSDQRRIIYRRPDLLTDRSTHYCPGCGHGIVHRLVAELLDEMHLGPRTIGVASVGCSVFAYDYLSVDFVESPHGRAPAVATGVRRMRPDAFVFTYQGDGDLAAIGTAEIVGAAARGERFSVIFVNNGIYGMTGGQMAPTTLLGQHTTSSPLGREASLAGYPIPITEMLALLPGVSYAARGSIADPPAVGRTKALLRRAFEIQLGGGGMSIVEVLSTCPVGWGMTPAESMEHLARDVVKTYPLGVLVDRLKERRRPAGGGLTWSTPRSSAGSAARACCSPATSWPRPPSSRAATSRGCPRTARRCAAEPRRAPSSSADRPIGSPIVDAADSVVALNPPSLAKFEAALVPGGLLVLNASLIEAEPRRRDIEVLALPCTALARAAGDDRLVSVVALGGLIARRPIVSAASVREALTNLVGRHADLLEADLAGFARGYDQASLAGSAAPTDPTR